MLGYPGEALRVAKTGRHGLARAFSPACAADLWALQARAHAVLGDAKVAVHAVVESELAFEHSAAENEPPWARFIDDANLSVIGRTPETLCGDPRRRPDSRAVRSPPQRARTEPGVARSARRRWLRPLWTAGT